MQNDSFQFAYGWFAGSGIHTAVVADGEIIPLRHVSSRRRQWQDAGQGGSSSLADRWDKQQRLHELYG